MQPPGFQPGELSVVHRWAVDCSVKYYSASKPATWKGPFFLLEKAAAHNKATHTASLKNKQNNYPFTPSIFTKQTLYARHCSKHGCPPQYRTAMLLIWLWAQHSAVWGPFTCEPHFGSQHQWVMVVIAMESCGSTFQGLISLSTVFKNTE